MLLLQGTLAPILQPQTKIMFAGELKEEGLSPNKLLCTKRAVVTGNKPYVFSGACALLRQLVPACLVTSRFMSRWCCVSPHWSACSDLAC